MKQTEHFLLSWTDRKVFLISIIVFSSFSAAFGGGISLSIQKAWNTESDAYVYSAGYMRRSTRPFQYYEGGVVILPASRSGTLINEPGKYSKHYQNSAFGLYGGYHVYLMPIFRPGIMLGTTLRDNAIYHSADNDTYYLHSYSEFRFDYYAAFSIQAGIFSFVISNYGIGGGLNYMF